jgi:hypothetical protein
MHMRPALTGREYGRLWQLYKGGFDGRVSARTQFI